MTTTLDWLMELIPESPSWAHEMIANEIESLRAALAEAEKKRITPPVLRWEGKKLMAGNHSIITTFCFSNKWYVQDIPGIDGLGEFNTEQEARRAAEKALGFPEGLIIEEV